MKTDIEIAAVGDILMWHPQIASARLEGSSHYDFLPMFERVAPYFQEADLVLGNLETTLSGREKQYQQKNPATGYPMFNCPDELAFALKASGFDVLTTANNHSMDRGMAGLRHTIQVLDRIGLSHTGTFASAQDATKPLVMTARGIRVGILAYTYGTNFITVPKEQAFAVSLSNPVKMVRDVKKMKQHADLILVAMHFGQEFHHKPSANQRRLARLLFQAGADVVLGSHPHVLQPMESILLKDDFGQHKMRYVIYSLGNFISTRMRNDPYTQQSCILRIHAFKDQESALIRHVDILPTLVRQISSREAKSYFVLPLSSRVRDGNLNALRHSIVRQVLTS